MKDVEHLARRQRTRGVRHTSRDEREHPGTEHSYLAGDGELELTGQHRRELLVRMRMRRKAGIPSNVDARQRHSMRVHEPGGKPGRNLARSDVGIVEERHGRTLERFIRYAGMRMLQHVTAPSALASSLRSTESTRIPRFARRSAVRGNPAA